MNNGWIKLHRKMTQWEWYQHPSVFCVFLHLLLTANHEEKKWQGVVVGVGQKITSYPHLARDIGFSVQSVRTALNKLKSTGEITVKTTSKYSLITISNWSKYQIDNTQANSQLTGDQQATNRQLTTNKNVKKNKNEKNTTASAELPPFEWSQYLESMDNHSQRHVQIIAFFFREKNIQFDSREKAQSAIRRHLRAAQQLEPFSDHEINKAARKAKEEYKELWTIETLVKILTR